MALELLCPAGDRDRLQMAVRYGADAVYLASKEFGMRTASSNFTFEELKDACTLAHNSNVKVYLTVNTLPRPREAMQLPEFLKNAASAGVDAFIIADVGIIELAKNTVPEMEIHASTQTGIVNHLTANTLYKMGCKRVVLARELNLDEIKDIRDNIPDDLELETFVHGAMCMSVSGRCLISDYLTGRDANRGACTQPCRWNYHLMEEKRPGIYLPVFEDENGTTIMSARDLCMIEHLKEVRDAGVISFKIEGRAKSSYYTAVVTNAYRAAMDALIEGREFPQWTKDELNKISHREYNTGFYFGRERIMQSYCEGGYIQEWEVSGIVEKVEDGRLYLIEKNKFCEGDVLELMSPKDKPIQITVADLRDKDGSAIPFANCPHMEASIPFSGKAPAGSILRKKVK